MPSFGNVERVSLVGRLRLSANPVLDIGECLLCGFAMFEFSKAMNSEYWPLGKVLPSGQELTPILPIKLLHNSTYAY